MHGSEDEVVPVGTRRVHGTAPAARRDWSSWKGSGTCRFGPEACGSKRSSNGSSRTCGRPADGRRRSPTECSRRCCLPTSSTSTTKAIELGDRRWRELLEGHNALVRRELVRFRRREIDTTGDGFFATFDGPARAIRCARAVVDGVHGLGLTVRAGLHTGECEIADGKVAGIAVHTGARVAALAKADEVLVSSTVKDLVAGSGITFTERGPHELKGIPGEWRVFAVDSTSIPVGPRHAPRSPTCTKRAASWSISSDPIRRTRHDP